MLKVLDRLAIAYVHWRRTWEETDEFKRAEIPFDLNRAEMTEDGFCATFVSPAIAVLADEAATMLEKGNAKNYIQFDMLPSFDKRLPPIRVTVQWAHGKSPAMKAAQLESELAAVPVAAIYEYYQSSDFLGWGNIESETAMKAVEFWLNGKDYKELRPEQAIKPDDSQPKP